MKYKITLVKSLITRKPNQVATAKALGLKKIGSVASIGLGEGAGKVNLNPGTNNIKII